MITHRIAPYDEQTGRGWLRYVQLAVERSTKKVQLVLLNEAPRMDPNEGTHHPQSIL